MSAFILLVDDNPADLELHTHLFSQAGCQVLTARDTRSAMEIFMREALDLVLLDFVLDDTDGGILAFEMRRRKPSIKLAFLCGDVEAAMPRGLVDAVIAKGTDPEALVATVRQLLEKSSSQVA